MSLQLSTGERVVVRVTEPGRPSFQLRKGEEGISVFLPDAVDPPLSESEILDAFRVGSHLLLRSVEQIETSGCRVLAIMGDESLTLRLRLAHAEICPADNMTRREFKTALKGLE